MGDDGRRRLFSPMQGAILSALVVIAGQSNALGYRLTPQALPQAARTPDPMVRIWTGTRFETLKPGVNTGTAANPLAWGPEVAFARRWRSAHPGERLYLVKAVKGSTGLVSDPHARDWSPDSPGELFDDATRTIAAAREAARLPVASVLWMQGEQDATDAAHAAAYGANLTRLLAAMRARWGGPGTRIVIGRIGKGPALPYAAQVRAAQLAAAGARGVGLVETAILPFQSDGLHLDAAGELALGAAFCDAVEPPLAAGEP